MTLTEKSLAFFTKCAKEAPNFGGNPWVCEVISSAADKGNLTDIKKVGLIRTVNNGDGEYLVFTPEGRNLAQSLNIELGA